MGIEIARHAGFCMGVRRAVDRTLEAAESGGEIVTFGEVVHNPQVIEKLEAMGVYAIHSCEQAAGKTVIIRSHGVSPDITRQLEQTARQVIDLTCPFVARLHDVVSRYSADGSPVILIGQSDHPEVVGTIGCVCGPCYTICTPEEAQQLPPLKRALAVSQTTFPHERWEAILPVLRERVEDLTVQDTICTATVLRQTEARRLAASVDAMLVVGGKTSANTRKLYETCKSICGRTLLVERAADIPPGFANIHSESIGITAGASTPDWALKEVVTRMTDKEQLDQINSEEAEKNSFMADVEATLVRIRPGQTVVGKVVQITDDEVCVNIGFKADGLIKREDLVTQDVKLDDEIEVEVVKVNDGEGNVLLSHKNVESKKMWDTLTQDEHISEKVFEGVGKEVVKGGLIATIEGVRAFVPASQLSTKYVEKIEDMVGKPITLKVIEVDKSRKRIVASHKAVMMEEAEQARKQRWAELEVGSKVKGVVRRLTDFGAFVDIGGGIDGLIHITDVSWSRVKKPSEVLSVGQEVEVLIRDVNVEKQRVSLGYKQLQPKPWVTADQRYPVGSIVEGKVVRIVPFGAFVALEPTIDGLIHISQLGVKRVANVEDELHVGDVVRCKVLDVNTEAKRISLSRREALIEENPEIAEEIAKEKAERERVAAERAQQRAQQDAQRQQERENRRNSSERRQQQGDRPERSERRERPRRDEDAYDLPPVEQSTTSLAGLFAAAMANAEKKDEE